MHVPIPFFKMRVLLKIHWSIRDKKQWFTIVFVKNTHQPVCLIAAPMVQVNNIVLVLVNELYIQDATLPLLLTT